jgi:hypothetical protein
VVRLDDLEAIAGPGSLTWRPVRATLGVRAFGCNAFTAAEAGQDVVEAHSEDPVLAHEELYFVARGSATFTIDGSDYEAPAGTYVFVPDPASHRRGVADEPGTTVLSFGGPPTFQPRAWEWAIRAESAIDRDPELARQIVAEGLEVHPDSPRLRYSVACIEAEEGNLDAAMAALRAGIEGRPELADWARSDSSFALLHDRPEFRALVGQ